MLKIRLAEKGGLVCFPSRQNVGVGEREWFTAPIHIFSNDHIDTTFLFLALQPRISLPRVRWVSCWPALACRCPPTRTSITSWRNWKKNRQNPAPPRHAQVSGTNRHPGTAWAGPCPGNNTQLVYYLLFFYFLFLLSFHFMHACWFVWRLSAGCSTTRTGACPSNRPMSPAPVCALWSASPSVSRTAPKKVGPRIQSNPGPFWVSISSSCVRRISQCANIWYGFFFFFFFVVFRFSCWNVSSLLPIHSMSIDPAHLWFSHHYYFGAGYVFFVHCRLHHTQNIRLSVWNWSAFSARRGPQLLWYGAELVKTLSVLAQVSQHLSAFLPPSCRKSTFSSSATGKGRHVRLVPTLVISSIFFSFFLIAAGWTTSALQSCTVKYIWRALTQAVLFTNETRPATRLISFCTAPYRGVRLCLICRCNYFLRFHLLYALCVTFI